jgi:mono/diheme cytochrome c family protein
MKRLVASLVAAALLPALGCRGERTQDAPIVVERNMYVQERVDPQGVSAFFTDHAGMRPVVVGTVPEESFEDDELVATGVAPDGSGYAMTIPDEVITRSGGMSALVHRGKERYGIFCEPCHGPTGDGKGMVARVPRGFSILPAFTDPRIERLPDGQLYASITNGVRLMPSYAAQIPVDDRWAIVSYVRALELSQMAPSGGQGR